MTLDADDEAPARARRRRARPRLHRGGALAHAVGVHGAARHHRAVPAPTEDANLGLYGAFGYDLAFQFDPVDYTLERAESQRDLVLYLPDEILVVDHIRPRPGTDRYDYSGDGISTEGLPRDGDGRAVPARPTASRRAATTSPANMPSWCARRRRASSAATCSRSCPARCSSSAARPQPSEISRRLKAINPSPYSFFINLGEGEYLVGASPEMFVRVNGRRVETCPISGTIKRGDDAISDSEQILKLLNSKKDESELTMCSDVDRNDKSRVCEPGSVRVIGRRQIEMYSRLIHTVDHIEGRLREGMDAFDAFLSPRLGRDGDRRAEALGDALHRAEREEPARLVWRRRSAWCTSTAT